MYLIPKKSYWRVLIFTAFIFSILFLNFNSVLALDLKSQMDKFAGKAELKTNTDLVTIIGKIVRIVLYLLGILFVLLIIYGGIKWMTSAGNEEQIKKAKGLLVNAVIGLVIVVLAYAIASFVVTQLGEIAAPSQIINPDWTPTFGPDY